MRTKPSIVLDRAPFVVGAVGLVVAWLGTGACVFDDIPACPGQCFEHTVESEIQSQCRNDMGVGYDIAFTGTDPEGYRGRTCFNGSSVALVVQAIDHLRAGGRLSDLDLEVQSAYVTTVNTVRADIEAECITAAPGQCTNAVQVCTGIAADAYEQLVIDETCVLALDGTEPVPLEPGQTCEPLAGDGTGSDAAGDHCVETTVAADGLDGTASSGRADETTG